MSKLRIPVKCSLRHAFTVVTLLFHGLSHGWIVQRSENVLRSPAKSYLNLMQNESPDLKNPELIAAAAFVTQNNCRLLGLKSIGVDYGLVRTGVAVTVGYSPKPLAILSDLNTTQLCDEVIRFVQTEQASKIIVGLPLHKNGTVAEQTNLTLSFAEELAVKALRTCGPDIAVELWDERYTSKEAAARAHSRDPDRWLYGTLDAEAACIILEHYYNDNGEGAQLVHIDANNRTEAIEAWKTWKLIEEAKTQAALDEREERLRRRKVAIETDRLLDAQRAGSAAYSNRKKKKKRKR